MSKLPVFYSPRMVADSGSYSPSAEKPRAVVESWLAADLPIEIREPAPATELELARAHDASFVSEILSCVAMNGFGNRSPAVAAALPYTSGAMLSAARWAIENRSAASAPCSGFHHAGHANAGGFCTFNGLMIAACAMRAEDRAERIGILDCDHHYGDGTQDIIDRLGAKSWLRHVSIGERWSTEAHADRFLDELPGIVDAMKDCDLLLYQAGADPHLEDPLGGWLTTEQLRTRDAIVFRAARELGLPVVWNLAGGYQRDAQGGIAPVLAIHLNTAKEWCQTPSSALTSSV